MIRRLIRRIHHDEDGTSLTEFVIMMPIYVMIFVFIANIWKLDTLYTRTRYRAATKMWDEAMAVPQRDWPPKMNQGLPALAASHAMGEIGAHRSYAGDPEANMKNIRLSTGGSQGEAVGAGQLVGGGSTAPGNGAQDFAKDMIVDKSIDPLSMGSGPFAVFDIAVPYSLPNTRHAGAIGTRYGLVFGTDYQTKNVGRIPFSFSADYDVLVSPVTTPSSREIVVVGFSRLAAEDSPCLSSVLEISNSANFGC